jgi:hypothetical protein
MNGGLTHCILDLLREQFVLAPSFKIDSSWERFR